MTNGGRQGCILAPTLFSRMLKQATDDEDGVHVRHHLDGSLVILRHLQANTKIQERLIRDLLNEDDAAVVSQMELSFQRNTSCIAEALRLFGLKVSLRKSEVHHQPVPYGCLASKSALGRVKFITSLSRNNTNRPILPLEHQPPHITIRTPTAPYYH